MSLDYETAEYQSNFIIHLLILQYIFQMNKKEKQLPVWSVLIFFNMSNLHIYFVIPAKRLTQADRNDFVLKNSHWPSLAVSSSSRKCYSSRSFYCGLVK